MDIEEYKVLLRSKIIQSLHEQGFVATEKGLKLKDEDKETYRKVQQKSRLEQISLNKKFLLSNMKYIEYYCRSGKEINPENISLELREILPDTLEHIIYQWWNLIWWNMPHQNPIGRLIRFMLWDKTHNAPFGLIALQSPVLQMAVRDKWLGIPNGTLKIWVNKSMSAHRLGALPPYNDLLGGKMAAISLTCNEIREMYKKKYNNDLLFITTTSAFGKSSIYNRLKYNNDIVAESLGYTKGFGTFHIPNDIYKEIRDLLKILGLGKTHHRSKKLRILETGFKCLGLHKYTLHNVKREFFIFHLTKNIKDVIQNNHHPIYIDRPFIDIVNFWKTRWCIPRAQRNNKWLEFDKDIFLKQTNMLLYNLQSTNYIF